MEIIENGVKTKIYDNMETEKELFLKCWEEKSSEMDVRIYSNKLGS